MKCKVRNTSCRLIFSLTEISAIVFNVCLLDQKFAPSFTRPCEVIMPDNSYPRLPLNRSIRTMILMILIGNVVIWGQAFWSPWMVQMLQEKEEISSNGLESKIAFIPLISKELQYAYVSNASTWLIYYIIVHIDTICSIRTMSMWYVLLLLGKCHIDFVNQIHEAENTDFMEFFFLTPKC